jgi:aryl-phospho-beta-D-glucosidase BglC (GH1 family)
MIQTKASDRDLLEGLAMRLESGRLYNGVAQPNADAYAQALRRVLAQKVVWLVRDAGDPNGDWRVAANTQWAEWAYALPNHMTDFKYEVRKLRVEE